MQHAVVVLAAGLGSRMKSQLPKVLHPLLGKPLLAYCVETALATKPSKVVVVTGHGAERVQALLSVYGVDWAIQEKQLGTAHALAQAEPQLKGFQGPVLLIQGDTPFTRPETLKGLLAALGSAGMALVTAKLADPRGYGRVLRDAKGMVAANIEEKDATPDQKRIQEINTGVYAFNSQVWEMLRLVDNKNAGGEYYLPDLIRVYRERGKEVVGLEAEDANEFLGINSREQLAQAEALMLERLRRDWMAKGVRMILPETIYLEPSVRLAPDATLWPGVILRGSTQIGEGAEVGAYSVLTDAVLGPGATVKSHVVIEGGSIAGGADAGPFARIRAGTVIESGAHVGNFVELKNAHLGKGAKAGHVSYLGDVDIGEEANIGAGTIVANFDGKKKHQTRVGKRAFIGSNSTLIAPVNIGDQAYVAAGSAINQDVPGEALGIAREHQRNIEGYARRKKPAPREQEE